jgi:basic amino acid/polyamine antiporter, APA family
MADGQLFAKKSVAAIQAEYNRGELKKTLGPLNLVSLGIGAIIGAGIFVITGQAAATAAGPALIISFIIAGLVCAFAGLCYAELASTMPVSGSAYSYAYVTMGEVFAWAMGWLLLLEYGIAASTVAVGWSGYAFSLLKDLGVVIPPEFTQATGTLILNKAVEAMTVLGEKGVELTLLKDTTVALADGAVVQLAGGVGATTQTALSVPLDSHTVLAGVQDALQLNASIDAQIAQSFTATLSTPVTAIAADGATIELAKGAVVGFEPGQNASTLVRVASGVGITVDPSAVQPALLNLVAVVGILSVTALLVVGISESASVNNVIVLVKVAVLLLFIGMGVFFIKPENFTPFIPPAGENFGEFGISGIFVAASAVFFAYVGFEAVSTAAGEAKNPGRDLPIGILGSLAVCTVLYILTTLVLTGVVNYTQLNVKEPMAVAADAMGVEWFSWLIKIGAVTGLSSVMLVLVYAQTRVFYQMSKDGLLPGVFGKINATFKTPVNGTLLLGCVIALAAATLPLGVLGDLVSLGTATAFLIVCLSVLYLRKSHPDLARPFKVPFYPVFPIIGILLCLVMIVPLLVKKVDSALRGDPVPLALLGGYLVLGVIIYGVFGYRNSKISHPQPAE